MDTTHPVTTPATKLTAAALLLPAIWAAWAFLMPTSGEPAQSVASPAVSPVTYVGPSTEEQRSVVDWAVGRFDLAGLELPHVEVSFPPTCGGKGARYFVSQARIELCRVTKINAVHELAHAWDDAGGVRDRGDFMERRLVDHWVVQEGRSSVESGGEQLAQIIAWGLMDADTTIEYEAYAGQPRHEHERRIPGLPSSSATELREEFVTLTGVGPLHETNSSTGARG